jgi:hypothetical protein
MQKDLAHAVAQDRVTSACAARLAAMLDERSQHFMQVLLDSRDGLVRSGLQALWVPETALMQANTGQGPWPGLS